MSREIKFRAWNSKYQYMNYKVMVGNLNTDDENWTAHSAWIEPEKVDYDCEPHWCNIDQYSNYTFMQYTGLKDKNGQEIYEGDVIKMIALYNDHHQKGAVDYASIYFSHGQFCIALDGYKIGTPLFNVKLSSSVEVIGNIHQENPELLK